jgi:hypothetical protein
MKQQDRDSSKSRQAAGWKAAEAAPPQVVGEVSSVVAPLAAQPLARHRWGRVLVNAFILWHLFALTIWLLPQCALRQDCIALVTPYMTYTGFMQGWTMFSPNPANMDLYVEARITYADGRVRGWNFPRMVRLGYLDRYRQERWRKLIENGHLDENQMVWPSLARYAARRNNLYPGNPPVSVALVRHFRPIPPPGLLLASFRTYTFFNTPISAQDLQ